MLYFFFLVWLCSCLVFRLFCFFVFLLFFGVGLGCVSFFLFMCGFGVLFYVFCLFVCGSVGFVGCFGSLFLLLWFVLIFAVRDCVWGVVCGGSVLVLLCSFFVVALCLGVGVGGVFVGGCVWVLAFVVCWAVGFFVFLLFLCLCFLV